MFHSYTYKQRNRCQPLYRGDTYYHGPSNSVLHIFLRDGLFGKNLLFYVYFLFINFEI
jgi:hypothetical protein